MSPASRERRHRAAAPQAAKGLTRQRVAALLGAAGDAAAAAAVPAGLQQLCGHLGRRLPLHCLPQARAGLAQEPAAARRWVCGRHLGISNPSGRQCRIRRPAQACSPCLLHFLLALLAAPSAGTAALAVSPGPTPASPALLLVQAGQDACRAATLGRLPRLPLPAAAVAVAGAVHPAGHRLYAACQACQSREWGRVNSQEKLESWEWQQPDWRKECNCTNQALHKQPCAGPGCPPCAHQAATVPRHQVGC